LSREGSNGGEKVNEFIISRVVEGTLQRATGVQRRCNGVQRLWGYNVQRLIYKALHAPRPPRCNAGGQPLPLITPSDIDHVFVAFLSDGGLPSPACSKQLASGSLATHVKRLKAAGYIDSKKRFVAGCPRTTLIENGWLRYRSTTAPTPSLLPEPRGRAGPPIFPV